MKKKLLQHAVVMFTCYSLAYAPFLSAAQLSLPSSDLVAPEISQNDYLETVAPGENHDIVVTVTDNVGVKQVVLFYRVIGSEKYKSRAMSKVGKTDDYHLNLTSSKIKSPGIEYYVQAMDFAGNTLLHGYSFSPISVKTTGAGAAATASSKIPEIFEKEGTSGESSNKWLWIGLGVLVLAGAAGGGSDDGTPTPTATLTITTAEPTAP